MSHSERFGPSPGLTLNTHYCTGKLLNPHPALLQLEWEEARRSSLIAALRDTEVHRHEKAVFLT